MTKEKRKTKKKINLYNLFVPRNSCNIAIFGVKHQPINDVKMSDININFDL